MSIALPLHLLAVVIWVGGMFFAYMVLRPVAANALQPPERLTVWNQSFNRFFTWVWIAVVVIPVSGYWMMFVIYGSMGGAPIHIHIMNGIGVIMIALYLVLFFGPYQKLKQAVTTTQWPDGAKQLAVIRKIVATNLTLGLVTVVIATAGRYL